jgi:hypothetical protein
MSLNIETKTYKIKDTNKSFTVNCERSGYADAILGRFINGTITEAEAEKLRKAAASNSGKNSNLIEACEIGDNFLQEAAEKGFYEYYDIIRDGSKIKARIRETGFFYPDPNGKSIRLDFGLAPGKLYENNEKLFHKRQSIFAEDKSPWASSTEFDPGDVLEMPASDVKLREEPTGYWTRL